MNAIGAEDVRSFASRALVGGSVTAALVSPEEPEGLLEALSLALGTLPAGKPPGPQPREAIPPAETRRKLAAMAGKTQAEIVAAFPGTGREDPDHLPLQLLAYILGETGYAGRLGKTLVDTGLTYSVYMEPHSGRAPGPVLISTSAAEANLEKTLSRIEAVLRDITAGGVEESEWRESQAYRVGRLVLGLDSPAAFSLALVDSEYYGDDLLDFPSLSREILAVTRERLDEVARRRLRPELLRFGVAGALPDADAGVR